MIVLRNHSHYNDDEGVTNFNLLIRNDEEDAWVSDNPLSFADKEQWMHRSYWSQSMLNRAIRLHTQWGTFWITTKDRHTIFSTDTAKKYLALYLKETLDHEGDFDAVQR